MTREELQPKTPIQCTSGQCYDKDEVDKVMDAMEARIKELEIYDCRKMPSMDTETFKNIRGGVACEFEKLKARIKELEAENKRLDRELKQTEVQDLVVIDGLREENERLKARNKYLENFRNEEKEIFTPSKIKIIKDLKKENARLRCLALHGMFGYACAKMNVLVEKYEKEFEGGMVHKNFSRWHRLSRLWCEAYRKAKKELMDGK